MTSGASRTPAPAAVPVETLRRPAASGGRGRLPDEFSALDVATQAVLAAVGEAGEWGAATRAAVLAWLGRQRDRMALVEARVLSAEREAGTWGLAGDRDLAGFVGRQSRQGRGAGMAAVAQAATLEALPVVAGALVDGPVTTRHLAEITRATGACPVLAAELATREGQAKVVQLAARLDGGEFGKALKRQAASLDPVSRQREHDEQRAARSLALTHTAGGTVVKGLLDLVAGHKLAKAIGVLCPRPSVDDERSREQRQADALMTMVGHVLCDKATAPGAVAPVQAILTFDRGTWAALRAATGGRWGQTGAVRDVGGDGVGSATGTPVGAAAGGGVVGPVAGGSVGVAGEGVAGTVDREPGEGSVGDVLGRLAGAPAVTDESGQAWPASEIGRALCDCALTRAVVGVRGEVLDLGRGARLFGRAHWKALYAAGVRTCQMPGCGMVLGYCELHHLRWWDRDRGRTDLANCAAYCSFHHHEIHRRDLHVTRRSDGSLDHHHPDGRPYGAPPGTALSVPGPLSGGQSPGAGVSVPGSLSGGESPGDVAPATKSRSDTVRATEVRGGAMPAAELQDAAAIVGSPPGGAVPTGESAAGAAMHSGESSGGGVPAPEPGDAAMHSGESLGGGVPAPEPGDAAMRSGESSGGRVPCGGGPGDAALGGEPRGGAMCSARSAVAGARREHPQGAPGDPPEHLLALLSA